jgi:hypothetical protein
VSYNRTCQIQIHSANGISGIAQPDHYHEVNPEMAQTQRADHLTDGPLF